LETKEGGVKVTHCNKDLSCEISSSVVSYLFVVIQKAAPLLSCINRKNNEQYHDHECQKYHFLFSLLLTSDRGCPGWRAQNVAKRPGAQDTCRTKLHASTYFGGTDPQGIQ
jgi:hypothetical protein